MDEYSIKLASRLDNSRISVFKMHRDDAVSWKDAKMKRDSDFEPWQIKSGSGKLARNFKATRDGGVSDNASYYIMYKKDPNSKVFEACPVDDWFSMSATQRYKTLTAEEAEKKFEKRHKMFNLFSVMGIKKNAEDGGDPDISNSRGFKVSEFDEWNQSGDDEASNGEGEEGDESKRKVRRKKSVKKEEDAPAEGKEESDEGDFEEREVDYMSDSSSESSLELEETKEEDDVKGIAEEGGLRDLLSTDDEDDDSQAKSKKPDNSSLPYKSESNDSATEDSLDSDDYDVDDEKVDSLFDRKAIPTTINPDLNQESEQNANNTAKSSQTSNVNKRKVPENGAISQVPKRPCTVEASSSSASTTSSAPTSTSSSTFEKTVEGLIVKYLRRKPMTLKALLKEVLNKLKRMDDATREQQSMLIGTMGEIIKRLNPYNQKINGEKYYQIKKDQ